MLQRRTVLGGIIGCSICSTPSIAQRINDFARSRGCLLTSDEAEPLMTGNNEIRAYITGNEPIIPKSNVPGFDRALAVSLARMSNLFGVLPGFGYFEEPSSTEMNAFATPRVRMDRQDGTVLFGTYLLRDLLSRREAPDAAVMAVCAHEYGHIVQYKQGLIERLEDGQPTIKRVELHADYLAGYFAGVRKRENPDFAAAVFAVTQHSVGDFNVTSRGHHGTPTERAQAVVAGFEAGKNQKLNFASAVEAGINYVGA